MARETQIVLKVVEEAQAERERGRSGEEESGTAKLSHNMLTCIIIILQMFKQMQPPTIYKWNIVTCW